MADRTYQYGAVAILQVDAVYGDAGAVEIGARVNVTEGTEPATDLLVQVNTAQLRIDGRWSGHVVAHDGPSSYGCGDMHVDRNVAIEALTTADANACMDRLEAHEEGWRETVCDSNCGCSFVGSTSGSALTTMAILAVLLARRARRPRVT